MIGTEVTRREIALVVNGRERQLRSGTTVAGLLESLDLDARAVVVERNGTILRDRSTFGSLALNADDVIEIVHFVGGG